MKKLLLLFLFILLFANTTFAASNIKIEPQFLSQKETVNFKDVNASIAIIFSKIKPVIKTDKYPKYYHDFTCIKDDETQNPNYYYVKNGSAELIFNKDTNELKYISIKRPELPKCRIIYDYPTGKLTAVQVWESKSEVFIFDSEGKYVNYEPYVKSVREKVESKWQMPDKKRMTALLKDKTSVPIKVALTLDNAGHVRKCRIIDSSKIKELDESVGVAIKAAAPFEKFPNDFFNEELIIILNFNFNVK